MSKQDLRQLVWEKEKTDDASQAIFRGRIYWSHLLDLLIDGVSQQLSLLGHHSTPPTICVWPLITPAPALSLQHQLTLPFIHKHAATLFFFTSASTNQRTHFITTQSDFHTNHVSPTSIRQHGPHPLRSPHGPRAARRPLLRVLLQGRAVRAPRALRLVREHGLPLRLTITRSHPSLPTPAYRARGGERTWCGSSMRGISFPADVTSMDTTRATRCICHAGELVFELEKNMNAGSGIVIPNAIPRWSSLLIPKPPHRVLLRALIPTPRPSTPGGIDRETLCP